MDSTPIYLKMDNINFNTFRGVVRRMGGGMSKNRINGETVKCGMTLYYLDRLF